MPAPQTCPLIHLMPFGHGIKRIKRCFYLSSPKKGKRVHIAFTKTPQFKVAGRQNEDIGIIEIKSGMAHTCTPLLMTREAGEEGGRVGTASREEENTIFYSFGSVPRSHSTKKSPQSKLNPSQLKDGAAFPPPLFY